MKFTIRMYYTVMQNGEAIDEGYATDETISDRIAFAMLKYGKRIQVRIRPV